MLKITKKAKPIVSTVSQKHASGAETESQTIQGVVESIVDPCNVNVSMGMTKNLGNYENVKFMVSLTHPCENNPEAMEDAFQFAKKWVETKVDAIHKEIMDQLQ